jgi:hypothetical protein
MDRMIRNEWLLRRFFRAEAHLWEYQAACSDRSSGTLLGEGFSRSSLVFMRLQRLLDACERSYKDARAESRLQSGRTPPPTPFQAEPRQMRLRMQVAPAPRPPSWRPPLRKAGPSFHRRASPSRRP